MTSAEVAQLLRVHPKHLYRLLRRGLPGHRIGRGHWRFQRDEVLAWAGVQRPVAAARDEIVNADLVPAASLRTGSNRVVLGEIDGRLVAHSIDATATRSADAIVVVDQPRLSRPQILRATAMVPAQEAKHNVLIAGCAPFLGVVLDRIERRRDVGRFHWLPTNSTHALDLLERGLVHAAGVHLEEGDTDHASLVRRRMPKRSLSLVRLVRWRTGLVVHPTRVRSRGLADLVGPNVRWALREPGAGSLHVLERSLHRIGRRSDELNAPIIASNHSEVGQAIVFDAADVGVAVESVAEELGLGFVPLVEERFDLVIATDTLQGPGLLELVGALDDPGTRREVGALGPYETSALGHAIAL